MNADIYVFHKPFGFLRNSHSPLELTCDLAFDLGRRAPAFNYFKNIFLSLLVPAFFFHLPHSFFTNVNCRINISVQI